VTTRNPLRHLLDPIDAIDQRLGMASWSDLSRRSPDLASAGRALLYQHDVGLAFLATVRDDGRPRLHPMCPLLHDEGLFAFIIPSPKQADLRRDGWYALHSFPCPENEDAFSVSGTASLVDDRELREVLATQFVAERSHFGVPTPNDDDQLFSFDIDSCLLTRTTGHGDPSPVHTVWHEKPDARNISSRRDFTDGRRHDS
jgi:hypothetical protein